MAWWKIDRMLNGMFYVKRIPYGGRMHKRERGCDLVEALKKVAS